MKPSFQVKAGFAAIFGLLLLVTVFQNCSDVKVSGKIVPEELPSVIVAASKPTDKLCAPKGAVFGSPIRIVIVLDMSMSNIGSVNTSGGEDGSLVRYSIDETDGPTDLNGLRFDQVKNFIDSCGGNVNVKYAVFGFSNSSQFARGQSCLSPFENQENALKTVEAFKQQQISDRNKRSGVGTYPFFLGDSTHYDRAITCLGQKIQEDLTLLTSERPEYHTFFLTDGLPDGSTTTLVPQLNNILLATSNSASGMHFNSVFYTSPGAKNQPLIAGAKAILDPMTQLTEGPAAQTLVLNDLSNAQTQFCSKIKPGSVVNYSLKTMYAVNLTAMLSKNILHADSDMDGVPDDVENSLSWNPIDYRSTGVLDGLCYADGKDKAACASKLATLTCAKSNFSFGMSECDRAFAAKIYGRALATIDSDKDLVPNFLEILRGTSPLRMDMFENPASDGIVNIEKISQGLDIFSSTILWPVDQLNQMRISYNSDVGDCTTGTKQVEYVLENVPLVSALDYADPSDDPVIKLSHLKDENVVVLVSVWQTIGGVTLPNRMYIQKWIVPIIGEPKSEIPQFLGEF